MCCLRLTNIQHKKFAYSTRTDFVLNFNSKVIWPVIKLKRT